MRAEVLRQVTRGEGRVGRDMQLTPRAKRVIDLAYAEARRLGNHYIGTEHLLLGLVREGDGLAGRVLSRLGVDLAQARLAVATLQGASSDSPRPARTVARCCPVRPPCAICCGRLFLAVAYRLGRSRGG